jgi:hypothetical protein
MCGRPEGDILKEDNIAIGECQLYLCGVDEEIMSETQLVELLEEVEHAGVYLFKEMQG